MCRHMARYLKLTGAPASRPQMYFKKRQIWEEGLRIHLRSGQWRERGHF